MPASASTPATALPKPPQLHSSRGRLLVHNEVPKDQRVHLTSGKGVKGVGGSSDDGLAFQIERGVQQNGDACGFAKALDQSVVARTVFTKNRLKAACAINVRDSGKNALFCFLNGNNVEHISRWMVTSGVRQIEIRLGALREHRWSKGAIGLAEFNLGIDDVFHVRISRIRQNAAIAEGTRPPFKTSLKPANHFPA